MGGSYDSALDLLARALKSGIVPSLEGIRQLASELGDPQASLRCVQVAGTNGKTSTTRFIEALLRGQGLSTGLYTSPHLERYPERMEVAGAIVTDEAFAEAVWAALRAAERLRPGALGTPAGFTEFELLTAAALWRFAADGVEAAVLEVGMGGRWDSTSVVTPEVAVITGVGLDHTAVLGDTLEKIAAEKAGILKAGSKAVFGPGTAPVDKLLEGVSASLGIAPVLVREGQQAGGDPRAHVDGFRVTFEPDGPMGCTEFEFFSPLAHHRSLRVPGPRYQAGNAAIAIAACESLLDRALEPGAVARSLAAVRLPGRFEALSSDPLIIVDGSHNPQAAEVLAEAVSQAMDGRRLAVLLGVLSDKDAQGIVSALAPVASSFSVTTPRSPRALPAEQLADVVEAVIGTRPTVYADISSALADLRTSCPDGLLVTGSLVTAGEARSSVLRSEGE